MNYSLATGTVVFLWHLHIFDRAYVSLSGWPTSQAANSGCHPASENRMLADLQLGEDSGDVLEARFA